LRAYYSTDWSPNGLYLADYQDFLKKQMLPIGEQERFYDFVYLEQPDCIPGYFL
jgi:hypothetical protein